MSASPSTTPRRIDLDTVGSTSDEARFWIDSGQPHPAVITARRQSAGRGRLGRRWQSPEGGAWLTVAWPMGPTPMRGGVMIAAAEAVAGVIDGVLGSRCADDGSPALEIRWPNDLLLDGQKVGGVLGESVSVGDGHWLLLGVGVNVNNQIDPGDVPLRTPAVALCEWAGRPIDLGAFLDALVSALARALDAFDREGFAPEVRGRVEARLADRGGRVRLEGAGPAVEGVLIGLDGDGALLIETPNGRVRCVSGELSCRGID